MFSFGSSHILLHVDVLMVQLKALHCECYSACSNLKSRVFRSGHCRGHNPPLISMSLKALETTHRLV